MWTSQSNPKIKDWTAERPRDDMIQGHGELREEAPEDKRCSWKKYKATLRVLIGDVTQRPRWVTRGI